MSRIGCEARLAAARLARFDPEPVPHESERHACLEVIAAGGLEPVGLDARLVCDARSAVVLNHRLLRLDEAGGRRGKEIGFERAVGLLQRHVDAVEPVLIDIGIGGLGDEMRLIDLDIDE